MRLVTYSMAALTAIMAHCAHAKPDQLSCHHIQLPDNLSYDGCQFADGRLVVQDDDTGKYGYVDKTGKLVIDTKFDAAYSFSEGVGIVKVGDKYGYIDTQGRYIAEPNLEDVFVIKEGVGVFVQNGKYGVMDSSGRVIIKPVYTETNYRFQEGLLIAATNADKWGAIDKNGKTVIDFKYDYLDSPSEGLLVANKYGPDGYKYGYLDTSGKVVIDFKFDQASSFSNGIAYVYDADSDSYYIDKSGKKVESKTNYGIL